MDDYPPGFEEDERRRSDFIRQLTLRQLGCDTGVVPKAQRPVGDETIPRTLVRFWHDLDDVPSDVRRCLDSWDELRDQGLSFRMFGDASAAEYIADRYGPRELGMTAGRITPILSCPSWPVPESSIRSTLRRPLICPGPVRCSHGRRARSATVSRWHYRCSVCAYARSTAMRNRWTSGHWNES